MNATRVYGEALGMAGPLVRVLAQIVVGHDAEAEPHRKGEAQPPGKDDAPEHPIRHVEDEEYGGRIAVIAHQVTGRHTPDQRQEPHAHEQPAFAAGMAEKLLFFAGIQGSLFHIGGNRDDSSRGWDCYTKSPTRAE